MPDLESSECCHHYKLTPPTAQISIGTCTKCGHQKEHFNWQTEEWDYSRWAVPLRQRLWIEINAKVNTVNW